MRFIAQLKASPIAINTREANEQHYELPCEFFEMVMGKHMKYSSCYFQPGVTSLDEAEAEMLALTCRRALHRRWRGNPRAGLRLGLAHVVDGRALSECSHHRRVELTDSKAVHRSACGEPRTARTSRSSPAT